MIDQIAVYSENPEKLMQTFNDIFGCTEWVKDTVVAKGMVGELKEVTNKANLYFNYQLMNCEFEILKYIEGENWHKYKGRLTKISRENCFLSHVGIHTENMEEMKWKLIEKGFRIIQEVETQSHTNENIKGKRWYKYVIFDTRDALGFDLKFIERILLEKGVENEK